MVVAICSSNSLISGENCVEPAIIQQACSAEPLNLIQEDQSSLLEESSPLFILTTI